MVTENPSFKDDLFGRKKFAENLMNIINDWDTTTKENQSCVFSADSPWGTGKTTFIKMWKNMLSEEDYAQYAVAYYNAWENDDSEKPFFPLIYSLKKTVYTGNDKKVKNGLKTFAKKAGVAIFKDVVKNYIGEEVSSLVQLAIHGGLSGLDAIADTKVENYFKEHEQYLKIKKQFINALMEMIPENGKLIVFVDELDRCRPTFAIETLEIIKHYFNIENIVFIFAIDLEQLSHSIATMYGQNMDASGYLRRFFDFNVKIPTADNETYLERRLTGFDIVKNKKEFIINISRLLTNLNMSLRDINKVIDNFIIFALFYKDHLPNEKKRIVSNGSIRNSIQLEDRQINCLEIYLYLLTLKYKYPKEYTTILQGDFIVGDNSKLNGKVIDNMSPPINTFLKIMSTQNNDSDLNKYTTSETKDIFLKSFDLLSVNISKGETLRTHFEKTIELFS